MKISKENVNVVLNSVVDTIKDAREKLFFKIILETSCKVSELPQIKIKDIKENEIKFSKRTIKISESLSILLKKFIDEQSLSSESFLFVTRQSQSITPKRIRQIIHASSVVYFGRKIDPQELRDLSIKTKLQITDAKVVKKEANLKRLDKRKYLSSDQLNLIEKSIKDKRSLLIFKLLLSNFKSKQIVNFKFDDILKSRIDVSLAKELEDYAFSNQISFGEYLFTTRQNTHLSKVTIFKIMRDLGVSLNIDLNPQIINNTAVVTAINSQDPKSSLKEIGIKTHSIQLHGGFISNE